jgi:hypothetical protein
MGHHRRVRVEYFAALMLASDKRGFMLNPWRTIDLATIAIPVDADSECLKRPAFIAGPAIGPVGPRGQLGTARVAWSKGTRAPGARRSLGPVEVYPPGIPRQEGNLSLVG